MRKVQTFLLIGVVAVLGTSCDWVDRATYDTHVGAYNQLRTDYDALKGELQGWANSMAVWSNRTRTAICDVVAKNGPSNKYHADTVRYCTDTDGYGSPPTPPDFGG